MARPTKFEHFRYMGDKRNQLVHDLDSGKHPEVVDDILAAEAYLAFGPDSLAEAHNRCYRPCPVCVEPDAA
jgi:hypothetical protein